MFSKSRQSELLARLSRFRSASVQAFDSPLKNFISESVSSMKTMYTQILDQFITGRYYFGNNGDHEELISNMDIWRIPVCI